MRIAVIGTGYVGLVAGTGFADFGNEVTCVDIDAARVEQLKGGEIPIFEPGLADLVKRNVAAGRLSFTTDSAAAVAGVEVAIIAVGTPPGEDGSADLAQVLGAARGIIDALTGPAVVITKSTVPVGTGDKIKELATGSVHPVTVASNPEFLKEGDAVNDFMKPARIVIGCDDEDGIEVLRRLYAPFVRTNDRIKVMDVRSAEITKYAANAMLATRISFMNEVALLCDAVGADVDLVRRAIGADPRIGPKFLFPGAGFGGSCFPKDIRALSRTAKEFDCQLEVVEAAHRANERQKAVLGARVCEHFGDDLSGLRVAVWGLAFKPETDDIREAPALVLIDELLSRGASVIAYDPEAMANVGAQYGDKLELADDMYSAAAGADALALLTEWHEFRRPSFDRLLAEMRKPVIFDGRNIWSPAELRGLGFSYRGIGRSAR